MYTGHRTNNGANYSTQYKIHILHGEKEYKIGGKNTSRLERTYNNLTIFSICWLFDKHGKWLCTFSDNLVLK